MSTKRTPEELWKAVEKAALDDEMEQAASMSVADAEKELAAAGFDVEAEKAEARAWREELLGGSAATPAKPPLSLAQVRSLRPPPRRPIVLWLAAAATSLAVGGGWVFARLGPEVVGQPPPPGPSDLRHQAFDACHTSRWQQCLARFDEAARLDPAGDADPEVQAQRATALKALEAKPK
jgi:hypothetical protein